MSPYRIASALESVGDLAAADWAFYDEVTLKSGTELAKAARRSTSANRGWPRRTAMVTQSNSIALHNNMFHLVWAGAEGNVSPASGRGELVERLEDWLAAVEHGGTCTRDLVRCTPVSFMYDRAVVGSATKMRRTRPPS